jgi:hypothetical protein
MSGGERKTTGEHLGEAAMVVGGAEGEPWVIKVKTAALLAEVRPSRKAGFRPVSPLALSSRRAAACSMVVFQCGDCGDTIKKVRGGEGGARAAAPHAPPRARLPARRHHGAT